MKKNVLQETMKKFMLLGGLQMFFFAVTAQIQLLSPPNNFSARIEGASNTEVPISWTSSGIAGTNYTWNLGVAGGPVVVAVSTANDTTLTLNFGAIDAVLAGANVAVNDTANLIWWVSATAGANNLNSDTFNIQLIRGVVIQSFDLVFPPNNLSLFVQGAGNTPVNVTWSASDAGATYVWNLFVPGTPNIPVISLPSNNGGLDTVLSLNFAAINGVLASAGVNVGDSINLAWNVTASRNGVSINSNTNHNLTLIRGVVISNFDLVFPPNNLNLLVEGLANTPINVTWNASDAGTNYVWNLFVPGTPAIPVISLPSNNSGLDTVLTLTLGAIDGLLKGAGLEIGDNISLAWNVTATRSGVSINSESSFGLNLTRGAVLYDFDLIFPTNNLLLQVKGNPTNEVDITWESAGEGIFYAFQLDAVVPGTFNPAIVSVPSNIFGSDTVLTLNFATIDALLASNGVNVGDTAFLVWRVLASNGTDTIFNTTNYNIALVRGNVFTPFGLLAPVDNATAPITGLSDDLVEISWTNAGAGVQYAWHLDFASNSGASAFTNPIISLPSDNLGVDTMLTLTAGIIDGLLGSLGLNIGDTADLIWTVTATDSTDVLFANQFFRLSLVRDLVLSPFALNFPNNGFAATIQGNAGNEVEISWTAAGESGVSYKWYLDISGGNFSNPIIVVDADNNGLDTTLTLNFATIDAVLAGAGLNVGDSVNLIWTVRAFIPGSTDSLEADVAYALTLTRGNLINAFDLLTPPSGTAASIQGLSNQTVNISWTNAGVGANYVWMLDAANGNFSNPIITVASLNNGLDTTLILDFETIDAVLAGAGVGIAGTANLIWTVRAFGGNDSIDATTPFALTLTRGNLIDPFDLLAPANNASLLVEGLSNTTVDITWESAGGGFTYEWILAVRGSNLATQVLAPIASNNSGNSTTLTLDLGTIDAVLGGANLLGASFNLGDTAKLEWAVRAIRGVDTVLSQSIYNIDLIRGIIPQVFDLIGPADGFAATIEGSASTQVNITWESAYSGARYDWVLRTPGAGGVEVIRADAGTNTNLVLDFATIDAVLAGAGVAFGSTADLSWTVEVNFNGNVLSAANGPFDISLTRGVLFQPFSPIAPADNAVVTVRNSERAAPVNITWSSAQANGNSEVRYTWQLAAKGDGFANILAAIPANNGGFDAQLTLTVGDIIDLLTSLGVQSLDTTRVEWRVLAENSLNPALRTFSESFDLALVLDLELGVVENVANNRDFQIFPNPINNMFNISWNGDVNEDYSVEMYDLSGKRILFEDGLAGEFVQINISSRGNLSPGMYVISVRLGNKQWMKKVVVN